MMGIHPSTYYRWHNQMVRYGIEMLRPRERRRPRMPNAVPPIVEHRVVAFALGHPGLGPLRIAAELARPKWGAVPISASGVYRVLRRHGLNTRSKRLALVAGYAAPPEREPLPSAPPERHLVVDHPGELVQMDCFYVGRLSRRAGTVWQYTAIDVASAYAWAELHITARNPEARWTTAFARRVAADLQRFGWKLETVLTDHGGEFGQEVFTPTVATLGARHRRIRSGRPQTNGCVERLHQTILEECWKPAFARYYQINQRGLEADLRHYIAEYNQERAHTGRWTQGRTPAEVIGAPKMWSS
jgi:transposase InsO family protein